MTDEMNLFAKICEEKGGHDFDMAGEGYYKNDVNGNRIPNVVYRMLFCPACGTNLEIIVADRRPALSERTIRIPRRRRRKNV